MKVFISWSGPLSHKVALVLRYRLPSVIQAVEPFVSSEDISKGTPWYPRIATELASSKAAIVVVTPENIGSVWVHSEAGALAKLIWGSFLSSDQAEVPPFGLVPGGRFLYGPAGGFRARGMSRHAVRLICAGWLPHDRCSSGAFRLSKIERHRCR